jgi:hypothetical protein
MEEPTSDSNDISSLTEVLMALKKLDRDGQIRTLRAVTSYLGIAALIEGNTGYTSEDQTNPSPSATSFSFDRSMSAKEFLMDKQPLTEVERVACLAYYLAHYKNLPHFQTLDITKLNTDAAQPKLSNPAYAVNNAVQSGYLVPASHGKKQLSAAGERFVQALPEREAAKKVMRNMRPRRIVKKQELKPQFESEES